MEKIGYKAQKAQKEKLNGDYPNKAKKEAFGEIPYTQAVNEKQKLNLSLNIRSTADHLKEKKFHMEPQCDGGEEIKSMKEFRSCGVRS